MSAPRSVGRRHGWCGGVAAAPARARGGAGALPLAWPRRDARSRTRGRENSWRGSRAAPERASRRRLALWRRAAAERSRRSSRRDGAWRANTPPARGHSGVAGESHPRLLDEIGEALLVVLLREWRLARAVRAAARGTIGPSGGLHAQHRGARAPPMLDIKLPHGRALLLSAANLVLFDQVGARRITSKPKGPYDSLFFRRNSSQHPSVVLGGTEIPRGWCLLPSVKPPFLFSSSPPLRLSAAPLLAHPSPPPPSPPPPPLPSPLPTPPSPPPPSPPPLELGTG